MGGGGAGFGGGGALYRGGGGGGGQTGFAGGSGGGGPGGAAVAAASGSAGGSRAAGGGTNGGAGGAGASLSRWRRRWRTCRWHSGSAGGIGAAGGSPGGKGGCGGGSAGKVSRRQRWPFGGGGGGAFSRRGNGGFGGGGGGGYGLASAGIGGFGGGGGAAEFGGTGGGTARRSTAPDLAAAAVRAWVGRCSWQRRRVAHRYNGSLSGGSVTAVWADRARATSGNGAAAGSALFLMSGFSAIFSPGAGRRSRSTTASPTTAQNGLPGGSADNGFGGYRRCQSSLTKAGNRGVLTLSATNTYSGGTSVPAAA